MVKLGIHDTAALARHAMSMGIIKTSARLTILTEYQDNNDDHKQKPDRTAANPNGTPQNWK
jgi:hypothetical protein